MNGKIAKDRLASYLSFLVLLMSECKFLKSVKNFSTSSVPFSSNHHDTGLRKVGGGKGRDRNYPKLKQPSSPMIVLNNLALLKKGEPRNNLYKPVVTTSRA